MGTVLDVCENERHHFRRRRGSGGAAGGSAGAGAGADGAGAAGVTAPDAGERILTGLGVPADKISKRSRARVSAMHRDDGAAAEAAQTQDDAANGTDDGQEMPKRLTWDEIMADPEYNEQAQKMMQKRLAKSKKAEQALKELTPALELMARKYGIVIVPNNGEDNDYTGKEVCLTFNGSSAHCFSKETKKNLEYND